jgi:bifunctional UDP-N-acetylglucosamine pyrophosphorylase/glucosamine-1-phosphate N-acetyltransferase
MYGPAAKPSSRAHFILNQNPMADHPLAGIILAAGKGTRMKSDLPKTLHSVCDVPMVELVGRAFKEAGVDRPVVVVGHRGDMVRESLGDSYAFAWQTEQLGTGHAALMAEQVLANHAGPVIVAPGDAPLLDPGYLKSLADRQIETGAELVLATCIMDDPTGYGRLLYDEAGKVREIVEEKDASPEIRRLKEVCVSVYCFDTRSLFKLLKTLKTDNAQGEYYLTDMVSAVYASGGETVTMPVSDPAMLMGVNDRWQLAKAAMVLRERILKKHAMAGVTIVDPESTYVGLDVEIGVDTVLQPMSCLQGETSIGSGCVIGPNTTIESSKLGDGCVVLMSQLNRAEMRSGTRCGPFANLRPGALLREGAKVGNFVEIKNSDIGENVSISHLTYIGDSEVGADTNIGAGTITCNFDGFKKHRTTIGERAFVGSNTTLVAPVEIGDEAIVAAGSVVTEDVPAGGLGIGRARQTNKEEWARVWRTKKSAE